jgi:hypothetical protein
MFVASIIVVLPPGDHAPPRFLCSQRFDSLSHAVEPTQPSPSSDPNGELHRNIRGLHVRLEAAPGDVELGVLEGQQDPAVLVGGVRERQRDHCVVVAQHRALGRCTDGLASQDGVDRGRVQAPRQVRHLLRQIHCDLCVMGLCQKVWDLVNGFRVKPGASRHGVILKCHAQQQQQQQQAT